MEQETSKELIGDLVINQVDVQRQLIQSQSASAKLKDEVEMLRAALQSIQDGTAVATQGG